MHRAAADSEADTATRSDDDGPLLTDLRTGDEAAFVTLVERYHASLLRLARAYVPASTAEDVVQETWLAVLRGLETFQGRATFKTWLFRIATNRARTRAAREGRSIPFSTLVQDETDASEQAVDPARFQSADGRYPGHWLLKPLTDGLPEERVLAGELDAVMRNAIAGLPPAQSQVVRLRDIDGLSSEEVCQVLQLTEGNQRVLLHRGRSKLRAVLEDYVTTRAN